MTMIGSQNAINLTKAIKRSTREVTKFLKYHSTKGITYEVTNQNATPTAITTSKMIINSSRDLRLYSSSCGDLYRSFNEISRSNIRRDAFNCYPVKGNRDFPISLPAEREQYFPATRCQTHLFDFDAFSGFTNESRIFVNNGGIELNYSERVLKMEVQN